MLLSKHFYFPIPFVRIKCVAFLPINAAIDWGGLTQSAMPVITSASMWIGFHHGTDAHGHSIEYWTASLVSQIHLGSGKQVRIASVSISKSFWNASACVAAIGMLLLKWLYCPEIG